jgi:hypothetical protein
MKPLDRDSRRLLDDATAADAPPPSAEARIWEQLSARFEAPLPPTAAAAKTAIESQVGAGVGGTGAGGAASVGGAAGTAGAATGTGAKIVIAALVAGIGGAGSVAWFATAGSREAASPLAASSAPAARAVREAQKPANLGATSEVPSTTDTPRIAAAPSNGIGQAQRNSAAAASAQPARSTPNLAEETQLLADAQRALSAGTPERALALIEAHKARFPQGDLSQEREAARVVALCALGRVREAGRARANFLRAWPSSPLASRVRAACPASPARHSK